MTSAAVSPRPGGVRGIEAKLQLGCLALDACVEVDQAAHPLEATGYLPCLGLQAGVVGAEELDLDRAGRSGEIVEDVLQHLHELDARLGDLRVQPARAPRRSPRPPTSSAPHAA